MDDVQIIFQPWRPDNKSTNQINSHDLSLGTISFLLQIAINHILINVRTLTLYKWTYTHTHSTLMKTSERQTKSEGHATMKQIYRVGQK